MKTPLKKILKSNDGKYLIQFIIGSIWGLILFTGGYPDLEPFWLRVILYPIWGLPIDLFEIYNAKSEGRIIELVPYIANIFIVAPCICILGGLILGLIVFGILNIIKPLL